MNQNLIKRATTLALAALCACILWCGLSTAEADTRTETVTINNLPPHTKVAVSFTLHLIDTWDGDGDIAGTGPDSFSASVDGTSIVDATFTTMGWAGNTSQSFEGPESHTHYLSKTIDHWESSITFTFTGSPNQPAWDEDWSVSEVNAVGLEPPDRPIPGPTATPQPTVTPTPPPPPPPDVTFPSTLRACAGGVDDHEALSQYQAHTRKIELSATTGQELAANTSLTLEFENNQGHDYGDERDQKTARLHKTDEPFDAEHPWTETLDVQTDGEGKVSVWVLSSDVICQPRLVAKWLNEEGEMVEVGSVSCDFAAAQSIRRFGLLQFPYEKNDTGWIFDTGILRKEGEITPAKTYLKFQKDPSMAKDTKYFNADGTLRTNLSDNGNWNSVNGHLLRMHVVQVIPQEGATIDEELSEYATLIDADGNPVNSLDVTTTNDGATQFRLKAGALISNSAAIVLEAEDLTQHTF